MRPILVFVLCCLPVLGLVCEAAGQVEPARHKHAGPKAGKTGLRGGKHADKPDAALLQQPAGFGVQAFSSAMKQTPTAQCGQASIAYIKCWLDKDGYVTGLAFEDVDGTNAPKMCETKGQHQEGGFLYDGETILEIVSCRGPAGGITQLEFHTDGNRMYPITCGRGSRAETAAESDESDEAVESKEWCESLTQGHMPAGAFEISKKGPRQTNKISYDWKEVYPLGGLTARCNKQGHIVSFKNTCWASETNKPNVHNPVLVEAWVQLNDGPSQLVKSPVHQEECTPQLCSDAHTSRQLSAWSATALPHLLEELGSKDVWVKHSILSCKPCGKTSGTMLQVALALYAQQGGLDALEQTLKGMLAWPEKTCANTRMLR